MRKTRYRPIQSNFPINQVLDKFLGTQLSEFVGGEFTTTTPATNITESEDGYQIDLAVPGLSKKDVVIEVHENTLIVKSEKSSASEDQSFDRREFNYSSFERKFFLVSNSIFKYRPVWLSFFLASCSGVPVKTILPPLLPPSGPISII